MKKPGGLRYARLGKAEQLAEQHLFFSLSQHHAGSMNLFPSPNT